MKIISDNRNRIKCNSCDTLYEYENSDLYPINFNVYMVQCPTCGQQVYLIKEINLKETSVVVEVSDENT